MSPGPLMERIYLAIKERIREGVFQPGQGLDVQRLSKELTSSVSPIRDALHRLEGERLVESHGSSGFLVPTVSEPALRDMYRWNGELLAITLGAAQSDAIARETAPFSLDAGDIAASTAELFLRIGRASTNIEHRMAIQAVSERLHIVRKAEKHLLVDAYRELEAIQNAAAIGSPSELRALLRQYHRIRIGKVVDMISLLRSDQSR